MRAHKNTNIAQAGIGHVVLIMAVFVALLVGSIGYFVYTRSSAASAITKADCGFMMGREWKNGGCSKTCLPYAGKLVVADPYDYCSNAASKISAKICSDKHRQFNYGVCYKEWNRGRGASGVTPSCKPTSYVYHVANPYDYCSPN